MHENKKLANFLREKAKKEKPITGTRLDDLKYFEASLTKQMYKSTNRLEFSRRATGWLYGVGET